MQFKMKNHLFSISRDALVVVLYPPIFILIRIESGNEIEFEEKKQI